MPHSQSSTYVKKSLNRLVHNMRDQVGLALLDLEAEVDVEILECRLEFIEEFTRSARSLLRSYRSQIERDRESA